MAGRHRISALGDDAGKARHAEDLEYVAGLRLFLAGDSWNVPDAQRDDSVGARFRAVIDRKLVRIFSGDHICRLRLFLLSQ